MGRPERCIDNRQGPLADFARQLRELRKAAGSPSYRVLAQRSCFAASTLSAAAAGDRLPTVEVTLAYVRACGGEEASWRERYRRTEVAINNAGEDLAKYLKLRIPNVTLGAGVITITLPIWWTRRRIENR
jgi:hypothetical protein